MTDRVGLIETWVKEKEWERLRRLLDEFTWKYQFTSRERKKGRAKGGIITGLRIGIKEIEAGRDNCKMAYRKGNFE